MNTTTGYTVKGHVKIFDPQSGTVFVDRPNAVNYEVMSQALAYTLGNKGIGTIYQMAFGNGAASISSTGAITYLPPNVSGPTASLYNQTYAKIVDDTLVSNTNPTRNRIVPNHVSGRTYTDLLVQCLLDYGEPAGQQAFDNGLQTDTPYTFDELGLLGYWGTDTSGNPVTRLLTHVVFAPVTKTLNRQIQVDYTLRIQALTNLITT